MITLFDMLSIVQPMVTCQCATLSNVCSQLAMGLCKCPKRKVTNLFCFEHRVNVCEHCLVSNHNKVGECYCSQIVWSCLYTVIRVLFKSHATKSITKTFNVVLYLQSSHIYRAQLHSQLVIVLVISVLLLFCTA